MNKQIDQFDEIRNLLKDREDNSYKVMDKLVDLLEKQEFEIKELRRDVNALGNLL